MAGEQPFGGERGMTERELMELRRDLGKEAGEVVRLLETGKISREEADRYIDALARERNILTGDLNRRIKRKSI
jgi:polyhydroxyalkanoate synthesis regulator phasin